MAEQKNPEMNPAAQENKPGKTEEEKDIRNPGKGSRETDNDNKTGEKDITEKDKDIRKSDKDNREADENSTQEQRSGEPEQKLNELSVVNVRLVREPSLISENPVETSNDAVSVIEKFISGFDREIFCILNLATDGKPISMNVVSIGTLNASYVSPREVFKSCVLSNAAAFLGFHCHPSGSVKPSRDDVLVTQRLKEAGDLMEIKFLDHIIVGCGSGKTYSFRADGLMDRDDMVKEYDRRRAEKMWAR